MNENLKDIKNGIIDKIIGISLIMLVPSLVAVIYEWITRGWNAGSHTAVGYNFILAAFN